MEESYSTFNQRFGTSKKAKMVNDFPDTAKIALTHILVDYYRSLNLISFEKVIREMDRIGRLIPQQITTESIDYFSEFYQRIAQMKWEQVFCFCERVYSHLLYSRQYGASEENLIQVKQGFEKEINNLLGEENIGFFFKEGSFQRLGRAHTNKSLEQVNSVLSDPKMEAVKLFFQKSENFFQQIPKPDSANCIKEAECALEATLDIIFIEKVKDYDRALNNIQNETGILIPRTIIESVKKIYAYRGDATGVAHASEEGSRVTPLEAELVMSVIASFITYLYDAIILPREASVPF